MYPIEVRAMLIVEEEIRAKRMLRRQDRSRFVYGSAFHVVHNPHGQDVRDLSAYWLKQETEQARQTVTEIIRFHLPSIIQKGEIPPKLGSLLDQVIDYGWLNYASAPTDLLQEELKAVVALRRAERVAQQANILRRHNRSQIGSL
jgi:hypothetical protein